MRKVLLYIANIICQLLWRMVKPLLNYYDLNTQSVDHCARYIFFYWLIDRAYWRFSIRLSVLTFNFDLDFWKVNSFLNFEHLCRQISWNSNSYFLRNHNKRNEPTNQHTRVNTIPSGEVNMNRIIKQAITQQQHVAFSQYLENLFN